jgi:glycosyltransferase involved in cell wall biosynthesis
LIKGLGLGGAERLLVDALPYWDRARFAYHVAYVLPWKDALRPAFQAAAVPVTCLGTGRTGSTAALAQAWGRLEALQRTHRFALIHADLPVTGVLARLVGRRHGVPVVYTEHNLQEHYHPLTRQANRLSFGWNRRVLAVSAEVAASLQRAGLDQLAPLQMVPNGVPVEQVQAEAADLADLRAELALPRGRPVVGTAAVFRRQKRIEDWLAVAQTVAAQRPETLFLLVGDGPERARVEACVAARGLGDRVRLTGLRADARRLIGLMDIFLMTSTYEGLPMALLEAMALGKPVVATAVGGIPEAVTDRAEGRLAPPGAVAALADAVLDLLARPALAQQMGAQGAQRVAQHFHTRQRVAAVEQVYTDLLGIGAQCPS